MAKTVKKKSRGKKRFRKVAFKLSSRQMQALEYHCKIQETSPITLIKDLLAEYTVFPKNYMQEIPFPEEYVGENQIDLMDMINEVVHEDEPVYETEDKKKWSTPQKEEFPKDLFS